jgi:hypothetical protein
MNTLRNTTAPWRGRLFDERVGRRFIECAGGGA